VAVVASCKKDTVSPASGTTSVVAPVTFGLYEYASGADKRIFIPLTKVGTQSVSYLEVFDTGSNGMTLDATDILPSTMFSSSGIQVTGDSVVVNGITVTSQQSVVSYGSASSPTKAYGNLAYTNITIGDGNGSLSIKRVPFFIYYKATDGSGTQLAAHSLDVFGVGPGTSAASSLIASPLSYYSPGTGLTKGFKLAVLNAADFNTSVTYVAGLLTIGLTQADISSSGFILHPLTYYASGGYSPDIPATITYNGTSTSAEVLFDTGTPSISIIEDKTANSIGELPASSVVSVTTNQGFTFKYTVTSTDNLTEVENPNKTGDFRTIFSLDFFISNEFLTDYTDNKIGLKNN